MQIGLELNKWFFKLVLIIAEAGVNHNGSFKLARELVDVAKNCGADVVKFQTFKSKNLVTPYTKKALYQNSNIKDDESQLDMLSKLELTFDQQIDLMNYLLQQVIQIVFLK